MILNKDRIGGVLLLIFTVTYGLLSQQIVLLPFQANSAFHARTMPEILAIIGVTLSLLLIVFSNGDEKPRYAGLRWGIAFMFIITMSLYGLTIRPLGFILSTSLFLIIGYMLLGERKVWKLLLMSVPIVLVFWLLMSVGLDIFIEPLPFFLKS